MSEHSWPVGVVYVTNLSGVVVIIIIIIIIIISSSSSSHLYAGYLHLHTWNNRVSRECIVAAIL
jgi:hypothetical protein